MASRRGRSESTTSQPPARPRRLPDPIPRIGELGPTVSDAYAKARLRERIGAGMAHEYEEAKGGGSH